jgi:hypothetical protein
VWIVLNGDKLSDLPPNAVFWIRWLPALVVIGAAARWLGHLIVIRVVAEHMRSIEAYFRFAPETGENTSKIPVKNTVKVSKLTENDLKLLERAKLGYESSLHVDYSGDRVRGIAKRFPAPLSELFIGALTLALTVFVSLNLANIGNEEAHKHPFQLTFGKFQISVGID